jgi:cobalt/nickel transport system ATP-binding protein
MQDLNDRAVHHLSFGQQKRVCVAGALAMNPKVLLLDEPTAGLDPVGEAKMIRVLHRLNSEDGLTIVLATHSVDLLPLFANKVVILNRGRVERVGPPNKIFTDPDALTEMGLRLPYISHLFHELQTRNAIPVESLPLTIGEARRRLIDLIPSSVIQSLRPGEKQ